MGMVRQRLEIVSPRYTWHDQTLSIKAFYLLVKSLGKNSCNIPFFSSKEVTHVWDPATFPKRERLKLLLVEELNSMLFLPSDQHFSLNKRTGRYSVSFLSWSSKSLKTTKPVSELQGGTWTNDTTVFADEQMSWPLGLFNLLAMTDVKLVFKKYQSAL